MFDAATYASRRRRLHETLDCGLVVLPGNDLSPMNFRANAYPFRQDSTFLYFSGLNESDLTLVLDLDRGEDWLFGDEPTADEIVFTGPRPSLGDRAALAGIEHSAPRRQLADTIQRAQRSSRPIHFLPPYRAEHSLQWQALAGLPPAASAAGASLALIHAVIDQRAYKSPAEIAEIEDALEVSRQVHQLAMALSRPGRREFEIVAELEAHIARHHRHTTFPLIFTVHGEILHQLGHGHELRDGDWIVHDSGVTSPRLYASDISRTFPVSGRFSPRQRDLYAIALAAQQEAIARCQPGIPFIEVHYHAARVLLEGLHALGIVRGSVEDALAHDVHTLFFPCGTGHHLGLDVHDMENLGESHVGYDAQVTRRDDFGWRSLRLGRPLEPGFVITVEPGLYFNPHLIDQWRAAGHGRDFIDHTRLDLFRDAGGVRVEDDVWITPSGPQLLGPPIPKQPDEVEQACQADPADRGWSRSS